MLVRSKEVGQDTVKATTSYASATFNPIPFLFPACQLPVPPDMIFKFQLCITVWTTGIFLARYDKGNFFVSLSLILRSTSYTDIITMSFDEGPGVYDRQVVALRDFFLSYTAMTVYTATG